MSKIKPTRAFVFSLRAADVPAAAHFYRDVIGLRLLPHHGGRAAFDLGDGLHLVIIQGQPGPTEDVETERFPSIAFAVDDLDSAVEQLRAHAVALPWGVEENETTRWVMFHDPAGNLIELAQFSESLRP